jgi:hypothetical protein
MATSTPTIVSPGGIRRPGRSPIRKAVAARVRIDPETPDSALLGLDGRSAHQRFLRRHKAELTGHLGGTPSPTQAALIESAAMLALHIHLMDLRFLATGGLTKHDSDQYLAWQNSYRRAIVALGMKGARAERTPTLAEYQAQRARQSV